MALSQTAAQSIIDTLDGYLEAFNALDLDRVVSYFADDALYRPGTGVERVGPPRSARSSGRSSI